MTRDVPQGRSTPQVNGRGYVTDGGLETDLIFHHGADLPHFAAFPLLAEEAGRALLERYYDGYAAIAARAAAGLLLEAPTWRANPEWGARLGYSAQGLAAVNAAAIDFLHGLRRRYRAGAPGGASGLAARDILVCGMIGPRGDGYQATGAMTASEAARYHEPQIAAFAAAGADRVAGYTLTHVGEAVGIVRAAREHGLPVAISFTVETDGRLPDATPLAEAIAEVDRQAAPEHFLVNCAHPTHVGAGLAQPGGWRERIAGLRVNASASSHAELDAAEELDEGDVDELAAAQGEIAGLLPNLSIVGGCCGTDARHVARLWGV